MHRGTTVNPPRLHPIALAVPVAASKDARGIPDMAARLHEARPQGATPGKTYTGRQLLDRLWNR